MVSKTDTALLSWRSHCRWVVDQRALAGLVSPGKVRKQTVRVAARAEVLKEASWGGGVDQRRGRAEGRSIWMLDQERSRAQETASARPLRGMCLGCLVKMAFGGWDTWTGAREAGRVDRQAVMRWLNCSLRVMGAVGGTGLHFLKDSFLESCPDGCVMKRLWGRRRDGIEELGETAAPQRRVAAWTRMVSRS